jgi:hypothetical protein
MFIKVQYDAINRTFKLVDPEFKTLLEGDALYDLALPLLDLTDDDDIIAIGNGMLAHA